MNIELDLSVCLVAKRNKETICRFLQSLYDTADPVAVETIVVSNSADQDIVKMISTDFPQVILYENNKIESDAAALNRAMRIAQGRYISLWDDDIVIQPESLLKLIRYMDDHPDVGISGPRIVWPDGSIQPSARTFPTLFLMLLLHSPVTRFFPSAPWINKHYMAEWDHLTSQEVDWLTGNCLIIRREVLEDVGFLDEEFISCYWDADYCLRSRRAGLHIMFVHDASLVHQNSDYDLPASKHEKKHPHTLGDTCRFLLKKWLSPKN